MSTLPLSDTACQVVVIGSGLPGSIMALVLAKQGYDVLVVDKTSHPRFAIGESSTPIADAYLVRIAEEFDIPELLPLSTFAKTRNSYPDLTVGCKRGFSYFWHEPGKNFSFEKQHENEMVVAASPNDELADSHWLRSEIDYRITNWFEKYGVRFFENCEIKSIDRVNSNWEFKLVQESKESLVRAEYFIDASGSAAVGIKALGGLSRLDEMWTNTSAVFAHFVNMRRWSEFVPPHLQDEHPFCCDDAAVHQLIQNGWMWQLRFQTGLTSCGIVQINNRRSGFSGLATSEHFPVSNKSLSCFEEIVSKYPSLETQFSVARAVTPNDQAFFRKRLQHFFDRGAGKQWCALPNTIGFVDPLHSKGMAHALSGVYRLSKIFAEQERFNEETDRQIQSISDSFESEIRFLDRLIAICYLSIDDFDLFRLGTFWYFAAATNFEFEATNSQNFNRPFLMADNEEFQSAFGQYANEIRSLATQNSKLDPTTPSSSLDRLKRMAQTLLEPFNRVGLFAPPVPNMYWNTTAPENTKSM